MRRENRGDILIYFCLLIIIILMLLWTFKSTSYAADSTDEQNNELFERTHEVDCIELSYEDAQLLMGIAQAEAGNQGADGMWLVMSVVLNRVESPEFPDTINGVIYAEHQFYAKGIGKTEISPECHEALARIEKGDIAPEIVAFEKTTSKVLDKYFSSAFGYRDHQFYTLKK